MTDPRGPWGPLAEPPLPGRLPGKTVLVTGSTKGFGAAMARRFAAEGANVVLTGRSGGRGRQVEQEIIDKGGHARFIQADVTDEASVRELVSGAVEQWGHLDSLVNNAMARAGQ
jgi:NAD(P)-dependent dehydrogenase (short-subunit alcohol dehydrogenase family)